MIRDEDIIRIREPRLRLWERCYLPQVLRGLWTALRHVLSRKLTVTYPERRRKTYLPRHRGLHRLNKDPLGRVKCVACFLCPTICPARCIHVVGAPAPWPDREKYPVRFDIDELRCIYCGMCEEVCPVDAIELTPIFEMVGLSRAEMIFDKEKLLAIYEATRDIKPMKDPKIVGYTVDNPCSKPARSRGGPAPLRATGFGMPGAAPLTPPPGPGRDAP